MQTRTVPQDIKLLVPPLGMYHKKMDNGVYE